MNILRSTARILLPCVCAVGLSLPGGAHAEEHVDGIAAVVGDEVILLSELEAYMLMRLNAEETPPDSAQYAKLRQKFLHDLIDGKVLLVHAKKDSTISVSPDDVEQMLERELARRMAQERTSREQFEQQLAAQGLSLAKFKEQLRKRIREQLLWQQVRQQYVSSVQVSRKSVEAFLKEYRDSLPKLGESVRLRKVVVDVSPPDSTRQAAYSKITRIRDRLESGEDFAELAKRYSDGPNKENGGDLGFVAKGTLGELAFEEKVFSMEPGQISEPFETRLGFHIVSVLAKRDQRVHVRQIFVKVEPPQDLLRSVEATLDSVRTAVSSDTDFVNAVNRLSTDRPSRAREGDIGWYTVLELPNKYEKAFDTLAVGAVSEVLHSHDTYMLLFISDKVESRELTLADDWEVLAAKAKEISAQKKIIELVQRWRGDVFVDIRL